MTKKRFWIAGFLALAAVAGIVAVTAALSAFSGRDSVRLIVNGQTVQPDVPPQLIEGRVMVPVRWVAEALEAEVGWDEASRTVTVETGNRPFENPYAYPRLPEEIATPEMLLLAYFGALAHANNLSLEQLDAAGGSLGMGPEPYPAAYQYWSSEWREKHSYEKFLAEWSGTAQVQLLKLIEAEMRDGEAIFFVETKHLEAVGEPAKFGEFYYMGYFTVRETEEGWKITDGELEPQNLAWKLGGHQPWLEDPIQVAAVIGLGKSIGEERRTKDYQAVYHSNDYVTVSLTDDAGNVAASVDLVRPEEGKWQVLAVRK